MHFTDASGCVAAVAVAEQVSHHPPVTAFSLHASSSSAAHRLSFSYSGSVEAVPRLANPVSLRAAFCGARVLTVRRAAATGETTEEVYEATCPALWVRLLPSPAVGPQGEWVMKCDATGMRASFTHATPPSPSVRGHMWSTAGGGDATTPLLSFEGSILGDVLLRPHPPRVPSPPRLLWSAAAAAAAEARLCLRLAPSPQPQLEPRPSELVWGAVADALRREAWAEAREAKHAVEVGERAARKKERESAARRGEEEGGGGSAWFDAVGGGATHEWRPKA